MFTSWYPEPNSVRRKEILECLQRNADNSAIDELCLLVENTVPPFHHPGLRTRSISRRPAYRDFTDWVQEEYAVADEDITIICNSDIYFDNSIGATKQIDFGNRCFALSRWDTQADGSIQLFDRNDSQDAWVFRGPLRNFRSDFLIGVPRCDNRMLYELQQVGYDVRNPAFSLRAIHLHAGQRADYGAEIDGPHVDPPYAYLWPHNLMSLPQTLLHRLRRPDQNLSWKVDWRKLQRSLPVRTLRRFATSLSPAQRAVTTDE